MSGTILATLLTTALVGPDIEPPRYIVQIDHLAASHLDGEPEPVSPPLCRLEVMCAPDGTFDSRSRIGPQSTELSGTVLGAENGKLRVKVRYAYQMEIEKGRPPEIVSAETSVEVELRDPVVLGGSITRAQDASAGTARLGCDCIMLSVRRESDERPADAARNCRSNFEEHEDGRAQ